MSRVYNIKEKDIPESAVYIGRGSKWGNPFKISSLVTRAQVIASYERYVQGKPGFKDMIKAELKGKDLICFCAPLPCHGDLLYKIANE